MQQTSYIELSKSALRKNIRYLQKLIGHDVKFVSVIKANAYGHGIQQFIPMAESCGIDYFATFDVYEAQKALAVMNDRSQLMIMGLIDKENLPWVITNDISFFVSDLEELKQAIHYAKQVKKVARIHLEMETGLNRTGIKQGQLPKVLQLLRKNKKQLALEGLCTHYAGAESIANYVRIQNQIERLNDIKAWFRQRNITFHYCHSACSAAAIMYPKTRMDLVRIGIAQYGFWPSKETKIYKLLTDNARFKKNPLHRVLSWKSMIMHVKSVPAGQFIGYGNDFQAYRPTRIAVIPVGYFHGYRRSLSNVGHVLIHGREAPIIGMVNMSMMITDVTSIPGVAKYDDVVLIGSQGKRTISVASFSERLNLVNYELLTRLPMQIPRYIVP